MHRRSPRGRLRDILATLTVVTLAAGAVVGMAVALRSPRSEPARTNVWPPAVQDCGRVTLSQGAAGPTTQGRCLLDAVAGRRAARLTVTSPTTEGDPITTYLESRTDGQVTVHTDSRADAFGSQEITRELCIGPQDHGMITFSLCAGEPVTVDTLPW